ncbi:MAG: hypothetical protein ACI9Z7_001536, partial [Alteromonas macleodii]
MRSPEHRCVWGFFTPNISGYLSSLHFHHQTNDLMKRTRKQSCNDVL